ncbi:peroxidase family protein [Qipengyuania flava]|uniref:peroxidase family protein n=1 Tax=Qipengyuania flava TaxID=192812 RepID=UPI001C62C227|nr:heme peroxidase family protein [Qipengyuania flava]QYJ08169.1 peroxidase [Qipengyuania flava]
MKPLEGMDAFCKRAHYSDTDQRDDRFGRLFGTLPPAYTPKGTLEAIGRKGGPMDGGSGSDRTDSVPVGMVFFGQFLDHDITLDASTTFDSVVDNPGEIANVRTPQLDLDCIYGVGPEAQPYLFSQTGPFAGAKLLTGADNPNQAGERDNDLLRSPNGRAIIGDPRNDENRVISQIQLAIIRFHNHVCDVLHAEEGYEGAELYEHARQETTWHYQWGVVNDFLAVMCGKPLVNRILGCGRSHYCAQVPFIPIEFSVAAYRFGHSMIPMKVQVQKGKPALELFGTILGRGFDALTDPKGVVDWHELLFTPENRQVERAQKLDLTMAGDLLDLPFITNAESSLATRNLLRGNTFLLPGGEKVAAAIGCDQATIDKVVARIVSLGEGIGSYGIPLWLYILAEAEVIGREEENGSTKEGEGLGPVGATIVAETLIGLLELDDHSYLGSNRNWAPRPEWDTLGKLVTAAQP